MKRLLSILIAALMIFSVLPAQPVFAAEAPVKEAPAEAEAPIIEEPAEPVKASPFVDNDLNKLTQLNVTDCPNISNLY